MVVRQTDKDETEVRVYKYGLVPIGYLSEQAISELWRANKLWNSLVALHYKSRDDFEEARCAAHLLYAEIGEFHGIALAFREGKNSNTKQLVPA